MPACSGWKWITSIFIKSIAGVTTCRLRQMLEARPTRRAGKARYLGASSFAWQMGHALHVAQRHGWMCFVSMQPHYNLLYREERAGNVAALRGAGDWRDPLEPAGTADGSCDLGEIRPRTRGARRIRQDALSPNGRFGPRGGRQIEPARGGEKCAAVQIALAWMLSKSAATAPIIGASKPQHLDDAVAALTLNLSPNEIAMLEEPRRSTSRARFFLSGCFKLEKHVLPRHPESGGLLFACANTNGSAFRALS